MTYADSHSVRSTATPDQVWAFVSRLGGDERIYVPRELWRARGVADRLVGGPGYRIEGTGRPLRTGDPMDFWQVVEVRPPSRLRVRALSRLPGTAHLDITVTAPSSPASPSSAPGAGSELAMTTTFEPTGLAGHAYWWSNLPAHTLVFSLMVRRLGRLVEDGVRRSGAPG